MNRFGTGGFQAPFLERETIWAHADDFRDMYWDSDVIPVDVFQIVECELDMEIRPLRDLKTDCDIDALLLRDGKTLLLVDAREFAS